jgi:hypothetical protein
MLRRPLLLVVASAAATALSLALPAVQAGAVAGPSQASYDGHTISVADGSWDGAQACASDGISTHCFDTEAAMDAWLSSGSATPSAGTKTKSGTGADAMVSPLSLTCSSSLRLYQNGGFGGRVLYLASRGLWFNLRDYSFDNTVSSFIVGACSSYLADGTNGGGSWYPGGSANQSVPVLASGWNDRISSVYVV